ncbi:MAG: MerR family transcriptional regulator [Patescibacteria group bacterium]
MGTFPFLSYRTLSHWRENNLLPDGVEPVGWHKFSFVEVIWVYVVKRLRDFGFPLEKIAKVKKQVLEFDKKNKRYPLFEFYLVLALTTGEDPYVVVLPDGTANLVTSLELEGVKQFSKIENDFLLISLKSILRERGFKVVDPAILLPQTRREYEALKVLRSKDNSETKVKSKNGKIYEIETSENHHEKPAINAVLKKMMQNGDFGEISLKLEKGVPQSVQTIKRRRL